MVTFLREQMSWHGVPLVIETDGSPPFNSAKWQSILKKWGIKYRLSLAGYPQSNGRAKRLLSDNVTPSGTLDKDAMVRAFLKYKNMLVRGLAKSPVQIIYSHPIRDSPLQPVHPNWVEKVQDGQEPRTRNPPRWGTMSKCRTWKAPNQAVGIELPEWQSA